MVSSIQKTKPEISSLTAPSFPREATCIHNGTLDSSASVYEMAAPAILEVVDTPVDLASHDKFPLVRYHDVEWDLSHLKSFAFKADIGFDITVVVLFSCHCFSHSLKWDTRARAEIPDAEIYRDTRGERILDPVRYSLSKSVLQPLIGDLPSRHIIVANAQRRNFMT